MAIVGIDLGTTNSLIGLIQKGRPLLFTGEDGKTLVPSVVSFPKGSEPIIGSGARDLKASRPKDTIYSAKRFIGRGLSDVKEWIDLLPFDFSPSDPQMVRLKVGDKNYTPIEISGMILRKLRVMAETQSGQLVDKAVITVPAYFNDAQRQATKFAGELAGLQVVRIINEPTAACVAYGLDKKTKGVLAVFDLGGGTFDVSILRVQGGVFEVLATNGDTSLGGDDFDHAIAFALRLEIQKAIQTDPWATREGKARLITDAENLKKDLSEVDWVVLKTEFSGKHYERRVTRAEIEQWCLPVLKRAESPVRKCIKDAKVRLEDLTDIILVGGSTRFPMVRKFVKELFRREPICSLNPEEVVAMGAAVQANVLAGAMGEILLLDVVPLSLGIETMGGAVSRLIHRNSTLPISATEQFTTYTDGQTSVDLLVVQGERELAKDNRALARFQLKGIPPLPAGIPKIEVEFIIDANGILNVRALELRTGVAAGVAVNPSYGLTDSEVESMLAASYEHAESDFALRFLAESRTGAESLIRATEKSLENGRPLLIDDEEKSIRLAISDLESATAGDDYKLIKQKTGHLDEVTKAFAQRILNRAVSQAIASPSAATPRTHDSEGDARGETKGEHG